MIQEREVAKQVVDLLDYGTGQLDQPVSVKLLAARQAAVDAAASHVHAAPVETVFAGAGRYLAEHWRHPNYAVTALLLLIVLLLATLMMQQQHTGPVEADALLLASDLPPEAYVDQGFDTWLKRSSQP